MSKNNEINEIAELLLAAGCDPANIEDLVKVIVEATNDKEVLAVGISLAIYLKHLAQVMNGHDEQTNLGVLLELADCYTIGWRHGN